MRAGAVCAAAVALLAAAAVCGAVEVMQVDRAALRQLTHEVGVASLLETGEEPVAAVPAGSMAATPADVESGDFEIKCSTSCDFVKKGASGGEAVSNKAALIAAQDLGETQQALQRVVQMLAKDPQNKELVEQKTKLELEVADKTHTLQIAVGANVPDTSLALEKSTLETAKAELAELDKKLAEKPADPDLLRQKDMLAETVRAKDEAMRAAAEAESEQGKLRDEVSMLRKRLEELQDALKKAPENGMIKEEMDKVQAELASKSAKADTMSPKKECYRVCVHPHAGGADAGSAPGGRRLLATTEAKDVNNCIRMCVKVMRMLVYRMAKKFL